MYSKQSQSSGSGWADAGRVPEETNHASLSYIRWMEDKVNALLTKLC